jgi:hypothetical protein
MPPRARDRRVRTRPLAGIGAVAASAALLLAGCAAPATRESGQSTAITTEDVQQITDQITQKLAGSDFLVNRTPESAPVTITLRKVVNYTSDVLREGDRWYLMYRVLDSFAVRSLSAQRNIRIVIPAERLAELRSNVSDTDQMTITREPTHVMEAIFRSVTVGEGTARTDAYYCQYRITELASGEIVWADRFELARAAVGKAYN